MNAFIKELKIQHAEYVLNNPTARFVNVLKKRTMDFMLNQKLLNEVERQENAEEYHSLDLDYIHYSDAPQYAEKYYGDVYHATTRYDNDWG
tara:strand:+ start:22 stop:294 length:273 start_codon:yes stop_codon:yes gene_type:complete